MITLPPKDPAEVIVVAFGYGDELDPGETLSTAAVTADLRAGVDASPAAILDGAPIIVGAAVLQRIGASAAAAVYRLRCTIITSAGRTLVLPASLSSHEER